MEAPSELALSHEPIVDKSWREAPNEMTRRGCFQTENDYLAGQVLPSPNCVLCSPLRMLRFALLFLVTSTIDTGGTESSHKLFNLTNLPIVIMRNFCFLILCFIVYFLASIVLAACVWTLQRMMY
ncbi:hypothetical protein TNCV_2566621 [Trichonephila clavipes]|uniref:Uncharacterized protein n=1 Tax=Trichonephila clavipes TaxID=2585209 RepID=A0A8X6WL26_TRICX|nr:hypothetical protein TNCV_2566621 [Trichonephila clavipes]